MFDEIYILLFFFFCRCFAYPPFSSWIHHHQGDFIRFIFVKTSLLTGKYECLFFANFEFGSTSDGQANSLAGNRDQKSDRRSACASTRQRPMGNTQHNAVLHWLCAIQHIVYVYKSNVMRMRCPGIVFRKRRRCSLRLMGGKGTHCCMTRWI